MKIYNTTQNAHTPKYTDNYPPISTEIPSINVLTGNAFSLDVSPFFSDPEGDTIKFTLDPQSNNNMVI